MTNQVDVVEIERTLKKSFQIYGTIDINPTTGLVSVSHRNGQARVVLKENLHALPVAFDRVDGNFDCRLMGLRGLQGSPREVTGHFDMDDNFITELAGSPRHVGGDFVVSGRPLVSTVGAPETVGGVMIFTADRNTPVLNILLVQQVKAIDVWEPRPSASVDKILDAFLNQYKSTGYGGMAPCAARLAKAGRANNARIG